MAALPLLVAAQLANPDRLNPDAVAYLTLARHWLAGNWGLAASGYWGPLFPGLVAALLTVAPDAMAAGRIAMVVSALLFILGALMLLRAMGLPVAARLAGAACLPGLALAWSVQIMTPDLLVSGLMLLGVATALDPRWPIDERRQWLSGLLLGTAYLAKTVAFPLGLALIPLCAAWHAAAGGFRRAALSAALRGLAAMLLVALPWIVVLSVQQGRPSIGTSGAINFAIAGPHYVEAAGGVLAAHHPAFTSFHAPRAGRVTAWEQPSEMGYVRWSPLTDGASALHFLRVVRSNAAGALEALRGFDTLGLGLAALLLALLAGGRGAWRFGALPVGMLCAIYLPSLSLGEPRYFLLAWPFLFAAAAGMATVSASRALRAVGAAAIACCFLLPLRHDIAVALTGRPNPALLAARQVADAVRESGAGGGVASVEELGFAAIFTAFLLGRPFLGTEPALAGTDALRALGAGVLLVAQGGAADRALEAEKLAERLAQAGSIAAWRLR